MEHNDARKIIEALLFVTEQAVSIKSLEALFDGEFPPEDLKALMNGLLEDYRSRGSALEIREIAGGWQLATRPEFGPWIRKLFKDRLSYRLSASALETLSIVAYKQPVTRGEIEEIRGVEVTAVLDTLVERRLLRIAGRKEAIGRPLLYGTTAEFLKAFGLKGLEDLPSIESLAPPTALEISPLEPAAPAQAQEALLSSPENSN